MAITGNWRTFYTADDLTDETYDTMLAVFMEEVGGMTAPGQKRDAFKATLRAIRRIRDMATAAGWPTLAAEHLAHAAGVLYGTILGEAAAKDTRDETTPKGSGS
jgi:hypothetical protein